MAKLFMLPLPLESQKGQRFSATVDLAIVLVVFVISFSAALLVNPVLRQGRDLSWAFTAATFQFVVEGLGPLSFVALRRERFSCYGLTRSNLLPSLGLGLALAVAYDLMLSWHAGALLWIPLRRQPAVRMSLAAGFALGLAGLAATVFTWGFMEGFFGIYFARKVNAALGHRGSGWFAPGTLAFALFNRGIHLIVGQGFEGFVSSFASGYAITVIPAITGNAWGGTLVQTLTNSVGRI